MLHRGFQNPTLTEDDRAWLCHAAKQARGDVLRMTTGAGSGHPGGALSSLDIFLLLFNGITLSPARDRVVISHAHTAAGVYAAMAQAGIVDRDDVVAQFRRCGTPFDGHVSAAVPGVEWSGGNLGQGLSVGCGMAWRAVSPDRHTMSTSSSATANTRRGSLRRHSALPHSTDWRI